MSDENKKRTAVWLSPGVIRRMDSWLEEDNCSTRSEFIEKALIFGQQTLAYHECGQQTNVFDFQSLAKRESRILL